MGNRGTCECEPHKLLLRVDRLLKAILIVEQQISVGFRSQSDLMLKNVAMSVEFRHLLYWYDLPTRMKTNDPCV